MAGMDELTTATCVWKGPATDEGVTLSWEVGRGAVMDDMDELMTATDG